MKYCIILGLLLGCTKPGAQKTAGQPAAAIPEASEPGMQAPLTPAHASIALTPDPVTGEVRAPTPISPRDQRELEQLALEAQSFTSSKEPAAQKKALALFKTACASCHGDEGRGFGPAADALPVAPTNFHEWPIKYGQQPAEIAFTLLRGRNDQVMPPLGAGMKKDELWSLVYLISSWYEARKDLQPN